MTTGRRGLRLVLIINLQLSIGMLACCSVDKVFRYKPGDMVMVHGDSLQIISRTLTHQGNPAYNILNVSRGQYVDGVAQRGMKTYKRRKQ